MSLLSDIENASIARGPLCRVSITLQDLTPEDRADLEAAIANRRYTASAISRVLRGRGIDLSDGTINRHRNGECKCP